MSDKPDQDALFSRAEAAAAHRDVRREAPGWLARAEAGEGGAFSERDHYAVIDAGTGLPDAVTELTTGACWAGPVTPPEAN